MPFGGLHHVLTLDPEGNPLGDVQVDEKPTGTAGNRSHLLVTTARGLLRFGTGKTVPSESSEIRAALITPVLHSPPTEDFRRWLRVEAKVILPPGSTLEIAYAATDDRKVREKAMGLAKASALPVTQRMQGLRSHLGQWQTISFHGNDTVRANESVLLSAPLFDIREEYLWASINLIASRRRRNSRTFGACRALSGTYIDGEPAGFVPACGSGIRELPAVAGGGTGNHDADTGRTHWRPRPPHTPANCNGSLAGFCCPMDRSALERSTLAGPETGYRDACCGHCQRTRNPCRT